MSYISSTDSENSEKSNVGNNNKNNNDDDDDSSYIEKNFVPEIFFSDNQRQFRYYKMIDKFFKNCDPTFIEKMVKIINKDNDDGGCISLRVLEWVVTKCSKKNIDIKIDDKDYFSINIMYKAQLKSYKKKNFDPFRRDRKFMYNYNKKDISKQVVTTLGQLNFFKWGISNKIIECVEKHYQTIIEAMNKSNKLEKIKKIKKLNKNKNKYDDTSTSKSLSKSVKSENIKIKIETNSIKKQDISNFFVEFD